MTEPSTDAIRALVRNHLPEVDGEMKLTPIPTGKFNTSYFVNVGARELVLRIAPPRDAVFVFYERRMMLQEPPLHELLLERTTVPVAPIVAFDESLSIIDRDCLMMERLPGRPLTEFGYTRHYDDILRQVGVMLAQVHALTAERYGYLGPHKPMEPQSDWPSAFRIMWNKLIDDVVGVGHYDTEEAGWMRDLLDRHMAIFDRPVVSRLLHMDVWGQNILVDDAGRVTGLIDWDRALWGDREIEFAVLDYCGISEPPFWEGYGAERDTSPPALARRVFYLLYELQKYIVIRQGRQDDRRAAVHFKGQVFDLARRALG